MTLKLLVICIYMHIYSSSRGIKEGNREVENSLSATTTSTTQPQEDEQHHQQQQQ